MRKVIFAFSLILFLLTNPAGAQNCVDCHLKVTPEQVADWQLSRHFENGIDCTVCHGEDHTTMDDFANVSTPTPATCAVCHETQVNKGNTRLRGPL